MREWSIDSAMPGWEDDEFGSGLTPNGPRTGQWRRPEERELLV